LPQKKTLKLKKLYKNKTLRLLSLLVFCSTSLLTNLASAEYRGYWIDAVRAHQAQSPQVQYAPAHVAPMVMYGKASYYGEQYQGLTTASGEIYDQYAMTAAHPDLPFGTQIRVTNLQNGRSVVVRVNDRGPFKPGRVVDVSQAAAAQLGLILHGSADVQVEVLG
ncbi:MAG: septal ring lytic transglycosylase RlpA family protein, partial [Thiothrix sp.]